MKIKEKNIDELLISYLLNELDEETKLSVEQWINASTDNKSVYEEVAKVWNNAESSDINFDNRKAWVSVSDQINARNITENKRVFLKPWMSIAASLLVLVSVYFIYQSQDVSIDPSYVVDEDQHESTTLVADVDQKSSTLIDGSIIQLNTNTQISYNTDFNKKIREVTLKGEAFFDIRRDESKPFVIHTQDSKIEVLGTSFNINSNPKDSVVTVFVKTGLVRFSYLPQDTTKQYQEIQLSAGNKVVYNKNSREIQLIDDKVSNQIDTYWMDKKLSFEGIRLEKVVRILEIIYDVKIVMFNKGMKDCQISVGFENDEINQIMDVIANTFNMEVEKADNIFILKGDACEAK